MKINPTNQIPFTNYLKIKITDKSVYPNNKLEEQPPLSKVFEITGKNKLSLLINKDVFILNTNDKVKKDLKDANIPFEEYEGDPLVVNEKLL